MSRRTKLNSQFHINHSHGRNCRHGHHTTVANWSCHSLEDHLFEFTSVIQPKCDLIKAIYRLHD